MNYQKLDVPLIHSFIYLFILRLRKVFLAGHHGVFYLRPLRLFHYCRVSVWPGVRADGADGESTPLEISLVWPVIKGGEGWGLASAKRIKAVTSCPACVCLMAVQQHGPYTCSSAFKGAVSTEYAKVLLLWPVYSINNGILRRGAGALNTHLHHRRDQ